MARKLASDKVLFTAFLAMSYLVFYAFDQPEPEPLRTDRP